MGYLPRHVDSPFGDKYVISLGYLVTMVVTIPLGFMNLDDNMVCAAVSVSALNLLSGPLQGTAWSQVGSYTQESVLERRKQSSDVFSTCYMDLSTELA